MIAATSEAATAADALEHGSIAMGSDGEWVSVRRHVRDAAVAALRSAALTSREAPAQPSAAPLPKVLSALADEWEREGAAKGVRDEPNARGQALAYRICAGDLRGRLDALASPQVAPVDGAAS